MASRRSIRGRGNLHSQRTGNKSIKITLIEDEPELGFTWSKYGNEYGKTQGKQLQKYCCTKCRSIYDKKKKTAEDAQPIPCLIFNIEENKFESENPNHEHYCRPQNLNQIRGKEVARNELAKIKDTRDKPAAVHVKLAESITQRFGNRTEEVKLDIARAAPILSIQI
uniref:Uncharacterized protein n=1 Tax=Panagrolaimus superbus TaxID=310955 RepID=A0A914ZE25_9BILA